MRFSNRFFFKKTSSKNAVQSPELKRGRVSRFESLESRDLLSLSPSSADYKALVSANSFGDSKENAIWVTTNADTVSASDGKISLREALDYAGQSLDAGDVSTIIRFSVGGTFTLSATRQSLKASKSVSIDASDVGGIEIQAQKTLALYVYGGSTATPVNVVVNNVTFSGGAASTTSGSAKGATIQVAANCNLALNGCVVSDNTSTSALGVGVYVTSGVLTLNDVVFSNNTSTGAESKGGAIYLESGSLKATNVVFSQNAAAEGGAVFVKSGEVAFENCFFDGNVASTGNGGAVSTSSTFNLVNTAFRNNASASYGGAVYVDGDAESTLSDVVFVDNTATHGGAVAQNGQFLRVSNANFSRNVASENGGAAFVAHNALMLADESLFLNNSANDGGAVYDAGSFYLTVGRLEGNKAEKDGGAINSTGYFEIRDVVFQNNNATNVGGSIRLDGIQRSWLIRTSVDNSSAYEGGGVYNNGFLTLVESVVADNVATVGGGGISNPGSVLISSSEIRNNAVTGINAVGGGVLNYVNATLNASDSLFVGNTASSGLGGAIVNNGTASFEAVVASQNEAVLFGGGVFNSGTFSSQYSTFNSNKANDGGAIADVYGSSSKFVGSTLWGNVASNNGGALYTYGTSVFQSSVVAYNVASSAEVAAYYTPEESISKPSFDSATTVDSNFAAASVATLDSIETVAVLDAKTGEAIDESFFFGGLPVGGKVQTRSFTLTNTGASDLRFSDFAELGDAESTVLSYTLYNQNGDALEPNVSFVMGAGETFTLEIRITPKSVGSKFFELSWTTTNLNSSGTPVSGTKKSFKFQGSAEIAKVASSTVSVATIDDLGDNISVSTAGSLSINLSKIPSSDAILYLGTSSDVVELSSDVLLFTTSNYNSPQTIAVSLDSSKLAESGFPDEIVIYPRLLAADPNYSGAVFAEITFKVADYVVFQDDCYVNLDAYVSAGANRWDFDGDGVTDAISYGDGYFVNSSSVEGDVITHRRTRNGTTTTTTFDVARLSTPPTAAAEVATLAAAPGFVRVSLRSERDSVARWRVNWGDGSPLSIIDELSTDACFAHSYTSDGTYSISIELVDKNGVGSGIWTSLPPQTISGTASSALLDDLTDFSEAVDVDSDVLDAISGAILAERERAKLGN